MRKSYVQVDGVLYEKGTEPVPGGVMFIPDIKPYQSMIDGSMITSRSQHREHLKANGCVEIGNEAHNIARKAFKNLPDASQSRKEMIVAQVNAMTDKEFRQAIKRDADRVKWNSNY